MIADKAVLINMVKFLLICLIEVLVKQSNVLLMSAQLIEAGDNT